MDNGSQLHWETEFQSFSLFLPLTGLMGSQLLLELGTCLTALGPTEVGGHGGQAKAVVTVLLGVEQVELQRG